MFIEIIIEKPFILIYLILLDWWGKALVWVYHDKQVSLCVSHK